MCFDFHKMKFLRKGYVNESKEENALFYNRTRRFKHSFDE